MLVGLPLGGKKTTVSVYKRVNDNSNYDENDDDDRKKSFKRRQLISGGGI